MGKSIFIVSNTEHDVPVIIEQLKEYNVMHIKSSVESLDKIEKESPDLVIINLKNDDISGFELCRLIKNTYKLPIITFTNDNKISNMIRSQQEGADACLIVPFKENDLKNTVEKLL